MNYETMTSQKAMNLALCIIDVVSKLERQKQYVLARQVLKSGTSVGSNLNESRGAQPPNDFVAKLHISLKEALETRYWLDLLIKSNKIDVIKARPAHNQCTELIAILTATLKSVKAKM